MIDARRFLAVLLVLASQLLGSSLVLCDEGGGSQRVEMLVGGCCAPTSCALDAARPCESCEPGGRDDCGPCRDVVVEQVVPREDLLRASLDDAPVPLPGVLAAPRLPSPLARVATAERAAPRVPVWTSHARSVVLLL